MNRWAVWVGYLFLHEKRVWRVMSAVSDLRWYAASDDGQIEVFDHELVCRLPQVISPHDPIRWHDIG